MDYAPLRIDARQQRQRDSLLKGIEERTGKNKFYESVKSVLIKKGWIEPCRLIVEEKSHGPE